MGCRKGREEEVGGEGEEGEWGEEGGEEESSVEGMAALLWNQLKSREKRRCPAKTGMRESVPAGRMGALLLHARQKRSASLPMRLACSTHLHHPRTG